MGLRLWAPLRLFKVTVSGIRRKEGAMPVPLVFASVSHDLLTVFTALFNRINPSYAFIQPTPLCTYAPHPYHGLASMLAIWTYSQRPLRVSDPLAFNTHGHLLLQPRHVFVSFIVVFWVLFIDAFCNWIDLVVRHKAVKLSDGLWR